MAHKYDNFDDAFTNLTYSWDSSKTFYELGILEHGQAFWAWVGGDDHAAIGLLCNAVYDSLITTRALAQLTADDHDQSELMESIYWSAKGDGPADVTMDDILTAMITAEFDELQKFIGLVDAYRVSVWNEPFNAEFYAALARGFTP